MDATPGSTPSESPKSPLIAEPLAPSPAVIEAARSTRSARSGAPEPQGLVGQDVLGPRTHGPSHPRSGRSEGTASDKPDQDANGQPTAALFDPFAPLTDSDRARAASIQAGGSRDAGDDEEFTVVPFRSKLPGPGHFRFGDLPVPSALFVYKTAVGVAQVVVARYDVIAADGSSQKEVRPWTLGRRRWTDRKGHPKDITGWHCKAPPAPRPLYGLDRLAALPDGPVLVCEGEKAADAASKIFPDWVCITSLGGAKAPGKTDWTPLQGRQVTIWPDHDEAGVDFAEKVTALMGAVGVDSVRTVEIPTDWPRGWDLADPLPEGASVQRLVELLDGAPAGSVVEMPYGFEMTAGGLFFTPKGTEKNPAPTPIFVAAAFQIAGETRSDVGEGWGLLLRWRDREGRWHQWAIPRRLIHRSGNEIAEELEHAGLSCGTDTRAHELLKRFVGQVKVARLLTCVTRTGWHVVGDGSVFVLPGGEAFGPHAADTILQADHASADAAYRAAGTLADWRRDVAAWAVANDRLVVCLSAAFAGPLLDIIGEPSGGIHLVGHSRSGKTTAAVVAGSAWGKPTSEAQIRQWRGTANGLEATAAETSDTLLILDEMGQADAREVADVVYMLANESGKQRASRSGMARRRQTWRTLFVSTGEVTLSHKIGEIGKRAMAGLEVRLVNLPADAGQDMGLFQDLHGRSSPAALAEELSNVARRKYGTASRAFLARLAQDRASGEASLRVRLEAMRTKFIEEFVPLGADGQVRSVAGRFALIAAAGELARSYDVLPWPKGEARRAAGACFETWLAERGGAGAAEDAMAITQVRRFFEAHGESRFTMIPPPENDGLRTINRAGYRLRVGAGEGERWEYFVLAETWRAEVCKGLDLKRTADLMIDQGWLLGATPRNRSVVVSIPGEGKRRAYRVSGAILGDDAPGIGGDGGR